MRKIIRDLNEEVRDRVRALADTEAFQQSRREMRFAHLKRILRLDRFRLRGLSGISDEVLVTATAQNLRRLLAIQYGSDWLLNFLHVMIGALWTGIDLFMGFVVGTVLKRLPFKARRAVIPGLVPRTLFLMPTVSIISSTTKLATI